jgi:hypothetical protein
VTESDTTLITFHNRGLLRLRCAVEVSHDATRMPELPLLVMLGVYLVVKMRGDAAA